jgi:prepilin-type N-terminal cleavage/methylation domain-containing protein
MQRQGFTLLEMMAATMVFLTGFVAVYGLFLGGAKFRERADITTRSALAASSIIAEQRLRARLDPTTMLLASPDFRAYPDQPGLFYRATSVNEISTGNGAVKMNLQFVFLGLPVASIASTEVVRRFRGTPISDLIDSGVVIEYPAVIYRKR